MPDLPDWRTHMEAIMDSDTSCPFEVVTLPNGETLAYHDERHAYYRECRRVGETDWRGVGRLVAMSTVTKVFDGGSPDQLMKWAVRLDREGTAALASLGLSQDGVDDMREDLRWLESGERIAGALQDAGLDWESTRNAAGTRGTNVHRYALQALAEGALVPAYAHMTDDEAGYARGVVEWWLDASPAPVWCEQMVADPERGVAGRLDLIATIDGVLTLVDLKTGKGLNPSSAAQLAGYRMLARRSLDCEVERCVLLQVDAEGSYRAVEVDVEDDDFLLALRVYRRAAELRKGLKG